MAIDLTGIEGLSEAQIEAINAANEADVTGLKNNTEALKQEKLSAQQEREDARKAAAKAEEDRLKIAGDMDGLKAHYETQLAETTAEKTALAEKAQSRLLERDVNDTINSALGMIHDDDKWLAKTQLSNMLKVSYDEQGGKITTFEHEGKSVASSVEELKAWASTQDSWKRILNGVDSSGAGVQSSKSGGAMAETVQTKLAQRLKAQGIT